ncbi:hypothetical protein BH09ACT12_BH09ACT12_13130 [soil metagenome]
MKPATAPVVRRLLTAAAGLAALAATSLALAGPASAEPSEGWPATEPVDGLHALLLLGGIPLLLFVVIVVATLVPSLIRGESLTAGGSTVEDQWLGGPRTSGELAAPDGEHSAAGGASGRW